ncbi:MAG TPA: RHS repeat-associated core domain-containing protein [Thermoanaerobaculia bacterium]|nr:RHS repeat-associated core domain-containing protein [Thermoanaerobaculia bacterium]
MRHFFLVLGLLIAPYAHATCNGTPSAQALIGGPTDVGLFSGTIQYNFPDSPRTLEWWLDTPNGVVYNHPVVHDAQGSIDFAQNTSCWPEGAYTLRVKATSCDGLSSESSTVLSVPSQKPAVSVTIDRSNPASPVGTVHYEFPFNDGNGAILYVEWIPGHTQILYNNSGLGHSGERTFTVSACASPGHEDIRATAGVCYHNTSADASASAGYPQPQLDMSVKKGPPNANGGRDVKGLLTWTLPAETPQGTLTVTRLPFKGADGQIDPGGIVNGPTSIGASGESELSISAPSPGQQIALEAVIETCSAHAVRNVANDCPVCGEGGASGNPVSYSDGNMRLTDTDPLPPIGGHTLVRTYNSDEQVVGSFGRGWTTMFERRLMSMSDTWGDTVWIVSETNDVVMFRGYAGDYFSQTFPLRSPELGTLQKDSTAGTYTYRAGGATEAAVFRISDGRLVGLRDLMTGHEAQFAYDTQGRPQTLTDSWTGLQWTFTLDAQHRVSTITAAELVWTYTYDAAGNLTNVSAPGTHPWRTYEYVSNRMTASRDPLGHLIESHDYDSSGRAINSTGDVDEIESIEYDVPISGSHDTITRVTEKSGAVTDYTLHPIAGAWRTVRVIGGCSSCGMRDTTFVRDARGRVIREQEPDGYVTTRIYSGTVLFSESRFLTPHNCDPTTAPDRCLRTPTALAGETLDTTAASVTIDYRHDDANWPERVTQTKTPSVVTPGAVRTEDVTYHATSGRVTQSAISGWTGETPALVTRTTATLLYGDAQSHTAAFNPGGGAFDATWLTLTQPALLPRSVDGPRTDVQDVTEFVYYPIDTTVPQNLRGRLAATKNAAGHVTRFEDYDVFGNAWRVVDPNGVVTEFTFDSLGRSLSSTIKGETDLTTTRTFTPASAPLTSEQSAAGGVTSYTYDARGRMATISRGASPTSLVEQLETTYDPLTGKKEHERKLGYESGAWVEKSRESYAYDSEGRLQTKTHADNATVVYGYDSAGRVASVKDENHTSPNTFYSYDPAGRLNSVRQTLTGAAGGEITTSYAYDTNGNLTSVTDPNGNATTYTYDDFGQMLEQESPVTGTTKYAYDVAGDLTSVTDANDATTVRTYDSLGRPLSATSTRGTASESVTWTYDDATAGKYGMGRLATMTDPAGTTTYSYERRGLLREEQRTFAGATEPYLTTYQYDANGNRASITYPSGLFVNTVYDFANRPYSQATATTNLIWSTGYLPFGPVTTISFSNGTQQIMTYDSRYRMASNKLTGPGGTIAEYTYTYDVAGNITGIADAVDAGYSRTFGYDDLNRLTTANTGATLWGTGNYVYDRMGNMLSAKLGDPTLNALADEAYFTYVGTTPKIAAVRRTSLPDNIEEPALRRAIRTHSVGDQNLTYDAAGNELTYVATRAYSPRNLLQSVTDSSEAGELHRLTYGYDGRGIRVARAEQFDTGTAKRYFFYNPELQLLSTTWDDAPNIYGLRIRTNSVPSVKHDFVWTGSRPTAQVSSTFPNGIHWYFTDHLGTPLIQTDYFGNVVWRAEYEPYGDIWTMRIPAASEESPAPTYEQPLRFPGQESAMRWEGVEERYNIFRWYRTGWGRYTQADPIGLAGSKHLYAYVGSNPVIAIDPLGLARSPLDMNCCELGSEINRLKEELKRRVEEEQAIQRQLVQGLLVRTYAQAIYRYWQHYGQYEGKQKRMNRLIREYDRRPCDPPLPQEVRQWSDREFPNDDYIKDSYWQTVRDTLEDFILNGPPRHRGPVLIPSMPPIPVTVAH